MHAQLLPKNSILKYKDARLMQALQNKGTLHGQLAVICVTHSVCDAGGADGDVNVWWRP